MVAGSQSGGQTLLAALWAQPPRLRGLESSRPPAFPGPLVPVWSLIPRQMSPHDPLSILSLRQSSPALQYARPSQVQQQSLQSTAVSNEREKNTFNIITFLYLSFLSISEFKFLSISCSVIGIQI